MKGVLRRWGMWEERADGEEMREGRDGRKEGGGERDGRGGTVGDGREREWRRVAKQNDNLTKWESLLVVH